MEIKFVRVKLETCYYICSCCMWFISIVSQNPVMFKILLSSLPHYHSFCVCVCVSVFCRNGNMNPPRHTPTQYTGSTVCRAPRATWLTERRPVGALPLPVSHCTGSGFHFRQWTRAGGAAGETKWCRAKTNSLTLVWQLVGICVSLQLLAKKQRATGVPLALLGGCCVKCCQ